MVEIPVAVDARSRILTAARPVLVADSRASIGDVAAAAGISRATFHRVMGSRADLISALDMRPDLGASARILEAAVDAIGRHGLTDLSMDELAAAAGLSRASLYRLFPGKAALFRELVRVYSPLEAVAITIERMAGRPPAEVMPELARAVAAEVGGRIGIVRALLTEVAAMTPDTIEGVDLALTRGLGAVLGYLTGEMSAGRLLPMHPLLALQAFVGPIMFHLLTRDLAESRLGFDMPLVDAVTQLADAWVRSMTPTALKESDD
ncbi:MAG TPA: helix-turn-helix domain-containing protein [Candidatus Dormibacteraeota bacterium]|nr:helix-turn-helix domain-containing protein [Candidatus Dormibacteraeota bacterium]